MRLIVLTGFLGSGKTTTLLSLAGELSARGSKAAMVINEIGDIGIDTRLLKRLGANVWELAGGCVCCTLAGELTETLAEIARTYSPEVVVLEPSGASHPDTIRSALQHGSAAVERSHWLAIVDPLRLAELVTVIEPLVESHVRSADAVLISKADLATANQIAEAEQWVRCLRPDVPCRTANMKDGANRPSLQELLPCLG